MPKLVQKFVEGSNNNGTHLDVVPSGVSEVTQQKDLGEILLEGADTIFNKSSLNNFTVNNVLHFVSILNPTQVAFVREEKAPAGMYHRSTMLVFQKSAFLSFKKAQVTFSATRLLRCVFVSNSDT
jgi:hypothetical protein